MTITNHRQPHRHHSHHSLDLISLAVLFVAMAAFVLVLVGVINSGSSPVFLLFPIALGVAAILGLRK